VDWKPSLIGYLDEENEEEEKHRPSDAPAAAAAAAARDIMFFHRIGTG